LHLNQTLNLRPGPDTLPPKALINYLTVDIKTVNLKTLSHNPKLIHSNKLMPVAHKSGIKTQNPKP